jgi:2-polyprenyl-6-methoxyphenol hydroxylase-like FAD-dependent oxidoreductase
VNTSNKPHAGGKNMGPKIVIIGGGIGGLTTAVALACKGLAAEVYEQAPELKEVGAGVGLWANALGALETIGLAGAVGQLGERIARQGVKCPDGSWLMCYPEDALEKRWGAGFVAVHRADLQGLLATRLDPAAIHLGVRCTGFRDAPEAVTVHFEDSREVKADVLIGADGVHSAVRTTLLGPAQLRYRGYTGVRSLTPRGSGSAAARRDRDLGPRRTLRLCPRTRRPDHLVRDVEYATRRGT